MSNPFNQSIQYNNMSNIRNIYQMFNNAKNPTEVFQRLAKNNPSLKPIMDMLNNGGNPQQIFYNLCQQRGIDPQEFLKNITG